MTNKRYNYLNLDVVSIASEIEFLNTTEKSCYISLLSWYLHKQIPLPSSEKDLAKICCIRPCFFKKDWSALCKYFELTEEGYHHIESRKSIEHTIKMSEKKKQNVFKRYSEKSEFSNKKRNENVTKTFSKRNELVFSENVLKNENSTESITYEENESTDVECKSKDNKKIKNKKSLQNSLSHPDGELACKLSELTKKVSDHYQSASVSKNDKAREFHEFMSECSKKELEELKKHEIENKASNLLAN